MDRQKQILIFGVSLISAGLLVWFLYANTVAPKTEAQAAVLAASRDMPLGTLLTGSSVKSVKYPARDVPKGALLKTSDAVGHVLLFPISMNEPILASKVSAITSTEGVSSTIEQGFRAVSVPVTDATGVAGLIQPNSHVDVLFTRPGTMTEASTSIILQNVRVLSTGRSLATGAAADTKAPRSPVVTLVMSPQDAQKLELAKNEGKISLSLRNPLDTTTAGTGAPMTTEVLDPTLSDRIAKARRAARPESANPNPAWQALLKKAPPKEPEKPRAVVDVYRGDKHVQESFR
jgi:pilus assembly protein CpaB